MTTPHVPVLLAEVVATLKLRDGAVYLDGTFGAGGYSRALLDAASCRVIAFDRDPAAIKTGGDLSARYRDRLTLIEGRFSEMESLLKPLGVDAVSGIVFDLGVSSMQLDDAARGFSFRADGPLDMRMSSGPSARNEKPRAASSSCIDETPRSNTIPETASTPSGLSSDSISENRPSISVSRSR